MPTLTKAELIEKVCENLPCTKKDACEMVEKLIEKMKETLCTGDEILISGFGKFSVNQKKSELDATRQREKAWFCLREES